MNRMFCGVPRAAAVVMLAAACTTPDAGARGEQPEPRGGVGAPPAGAVALEPLSPLADSIAQTLVFAPSNQEWFVAAVRAGRLLVDIGRVDASVRRAGTREIDSVRFAAYQQAVERRSHVRRGDILRLRGRWGADDATVSGYDWWNGRIVATLTLPPAIESIARRDPALVATAQRTGIITPPVADSCARDSIAAGLAERAQLVRDSLRAAVLADSLRFPARVRSSLRASSTALPGCFGDARLLVFAAVRAPRDEFGAERAALVDSAGRVRRLQIVDYRFRAHDPIMSFDADGDGVDDVAARGYAEAAGGTTVLRLIDGRRLERLTGGFAWEER